MYLYRPEGLGFGEITGEAAVAREPDQLPTPGELQAASKDSVLDQDGNVSLSSKAFMPQISMYIL